MSQLLLAQGIWVPRGKGYLILPKLIVDCQFQKTFCRQGGINSSQMLEVLCLEHHFDVSTVKHIEKGFANQLVLVNLGRTLYRLDDFLSFLCLAALWHCQFLKMPDNKKLSGNEFKSSGFMLAVNLAILSDN